MRGVGRATDSVEWIVRSRGSALTAGAARRAGALARPPNDPTAVNRWTTLPFFYTVGTHL